MKRRDALEWIVATACGAAMSSRATPESAVRRVGVLFRGEPGREAPFLVELATHLNAFGWKRDHNLEFVVRVTRDAADRDSKARELVGAGIDVVLTAGTDMTLALLRATRSIPIVTQLSDPVRAGVAESIARPGGNVTGLAFLPQELVDKQVEILVSVVRKATALRLFTGPGVRFVPEMTAPVADAAARHGLAFAASFVQDLAGFASAFDAMQRNAVAYVHNFTRLVDGHRLAALAIERRVPTFHAIPEFVGDGGLMSYAMRYRDELARTAAVVDRILRGAKASEMPFELPRDTIFAINRTTAHALGIEITPEILLRATEVVG